jgi:hypothetical protein
MSTAIQVVGIVLISVMVKSINMQSPLHAISIKRVL